MRRTVIYVAIIVVSFLIAFSCENTGSVGVNCNECYFPEPDSADLLVYLTINIANPYVPIKIYRGKVEENQLDWTDTVYSKEYRLYSAVNQYYSIEATYKDGTKRIIAVDGDKISTSLVTDVCDNDCWVLKGGVLDVRLKNQ